MAKTFRNLKITKSDFNDIMANQTFNALVASTQVGDKFYVPLERDLLVLGTDINARDAAGNELMDEAGKPVRRSVAQRFCAVRVVDNKPVEVRELYVGQLVKVDANRRIVFPGTLSNALRHGDAAFKEAICGMILEVIDEKECDARIWVESEARWKRNEDGTFASQKKTALHFDPKRNTMPSEEIEKAINMLYDYYKEHYRDHVSTEERVEVTVCLAI